MRCADCFDETDSSEMVQDISTGEHICLNCWATYDPDERAHDHDDTEFDDTDDLAW